MNTTTTSDTLGLDDGRIPATILTGFLGSGKTTLLNRILHANEGMRIAIIVNEIGAVGIDGGLIENVGEDDIVEITAGCICCTVRGDLLAGIVRILERPEPPEYLIIETSGISDPLPVAQTMFLPALRQIVRLDGIVTVVDADQFYRQLRSSQMVKEQLEFANMLVVSKVDLVDAKLLHAVEATLHELNPYAPILYSGKDRPVDLRALLDVGAFSIDDRFTAGAESWLAEEEAHERSHHAADHDHDHESDHDHDHDHDHEAHAHEHHHHHGHLEDEGISSVSFVTREPFAVEKIEEFYNNLGENVLRGKGVLNLAEYPETRCIFHQVGARVTVEAQGTWQPDTPRESRLVFIGQHLDEETMREQLRACLAPSVVAP